MPDLDDRCDTCGSLLDEEDLFCGNCGREAPRGAVPVAPLSQRITNAFTCAGCGASMSYDASAGSLRCPFCGSLNLAKAAEETVFAPRRIVPFAVKREAAEASLRQWLGRSVWRPRDLTRQAQVLSMSPVYV